MITEIDKTHFLADARERAAHVTFVVTAVGDPLAEETDILASWALLKERLHGIGTRMGYRTFMALVDGSESDLRTEIEAFSSGQNTCASWRIVAAPVDKSEDFFMLLNETEWRASKAAFDHHLPVLRVVRLGKAV